MSQKDGMRAVRKYRLSRTDSEVKLPVGARPLRVDEQGDLRVLWADVDPDQKTEVTVRVLVVGTGWDFEDKGLTYLNTFYEGPFVWHAYVASTDAQGQEAARA